MSNEVVGKLVRGVIYDEDIQPLKNEIFDQLSFDGINTITNYFVKEMHEDTDHCISLEDAKLYFDNMNAISALVGYNEETGKTSNLIIPKKSLSTGLVHELDKVDLGKNLLMEYADDFFVNYIGATRKSDKEIKHEEVKTLPVVNNNIEVPNNIILFVDGKQVNKEEFEVFLQNNPDMADLMFRATRSLTREI